MEKLNSSLDAPDSYIPSEWTTPSKLKKLKAPFLQVIFYIIKQIAIKKVEISDKSKKEDKKQQPTGKKAPAKK
jgi:hypothetical protein